MITSSTPAEITLAPTTAPTADPAVPALVHAADLLISPTSRTRRFVGVEHGSGVSYFFVDYEAGQGTDLHWHPYPETWVVLEGTATLTIGDRRVTATVGDTATVPTGVWHRFANAGAERLKMLCIHASPVIIQTWADEAAAAAAEPAPEPAPAPATSERTDA